MLLDPLKTIISDPSFVFVWGIFLKIIKFWWWLPLPFILWPKLIFLWLWWRQNDIWDNTWKKVMIEIKVPSESLKPIRAMETVMTGLWQVYSPPNWHEKWWRGKYLVGFSFEIASIDGIPHFYIRMPEQYRSIAESHIYSQYPEAEISEVEDYTAKVPPDIPNKDWDVWGTDYELLRPDPYPIKTYPQFETERESEEEKRIDPISSLLEGLSQLGPGEQIWVQIYSVPFIDELKKWVEEGEKLRDELASRRAKPEDKLVISKIYDLLVHAKPPEAVEETKEEVLPPEMKLTPGEKEVVAAVEKKISKIGFMSFVRYVYVAKRDAYSTTKTRIAMSYFTNFVTNNLNSIKPLGATITKVKRNWYDWFWMQNMRLYQKKRRLFRNFLLRVPPYFPKDGGTFVLNVEELATIYHFPSRIMAPAAALPRVEAKKSEAPPDLPVG